MKERNKAFKLKVNIAKRDYFYNKISKSNNVSKTVWNLINKEVSNNLKYPYITKLNVNNNICTNPEKLCNAFNNHFIDVVECEVLPEIRVSSDFTEPDLGILPDTPFCKCDPVNEEEIIKIIESFDNKYSTGFDEIPMPVIKQARHFLVKPLVHLINSSFITGIFPNKLKISKIRPLFKKGNETVISNYRPLALLPIFSKIYERAMYNRLLYHLEFNNLLDKEQHGFRQGKSVVTAAVDFIESVVNSVENKERAIGIFMDLSKAFDSESHKLINR